MLFCENELRTKLKLTLDEIAPYNQFLQKKVENLNAFNSIQRKGLSYPNDVERILLYTTTAGESIYIEVPGKESVRDGVKRYLYDFKPVLKNNKLQWVPDLSFGNIWEYFFNISKVDENLLDVVASVMIRMAYMIDYDKIKEDCLVECLNDGKIDFLKNLNFSWYKLNLDKDIWVFLNNKYSALESCFGLSFEGFIYYNDLIVQNEDCKYYYFDINKKDSTRIAVKDANPFYEVTGVNVFDKNINYKISNKSKGRVNTCLTHLNFLAYLNGNISVAQFFDDIQQKRGVAPISNKVLREFCKDIAEFR